MCCVVGRTKLSDFMETEDKRFLLVPENLKLDTLMPKKVGGADALLLGGVGGGGRAAAQRRQEEAPRRGQLVMMRLLLVWLGGVA